MTSLLVYLLMSQHQVAIPNLPDRSNGNILQHIEITHQDISNQLDRLKTSKSCGYDNCHPRVLKSVKEGIIVPLYYLYNSKSLEQASLPLSWKELSYNNSNFLKR